MDYSISENENGLCGVFDVTGFSIEDLDICVKGGFLCIEGRVDVEEDGCTSKNSINYRVGIPHEHLESAMSAKLNGYELTVTIGAPNVEASSLKVKKIPITTS